MMKRSWLVLGSLILLSVLAISVVDAASVNFTSPIESQNVKGSVNVAWSAGDFETASLLYQSGKCTSSGTGGIVILSSVTNVSGTTSWNTDSLSDGWYCLKMASGASVFGSVNVTVDNTAPNVSLVILQNGKENDTFSAQTNTTINVSSFDSISGVTSCSINWADGNTSSCLANGIFAHQYADNGMYTIVVNATDAAGNSGLVNTIANVTNVNPWALSINASSGLAKGVPVQLQGNAADVNADVPTLVYRWDFGDGSSVLIGKDVSHIYGSAGNYTIVLSVSDKDGGISSLNATITVMPLSQLQNQEVIAIHLMQYEPAISSLGAISSCALEFPASYPNLTVSALNATTCRIRWTPTNAQNSKDAQTQIAIRVTGAGGYAYFGFNVTVYSWITPLSTGVNLISLPLVPSSTYYQDVFSKIKCNMSKVWAYTYNVSSGKSEWSYKTVSSSCGWSVGTLYDIMPGNGYFVVMNNIDTLKGFGSKMYNENANPSPPVVTLTPGWNLIGQYGLNSLNKSEALASIGSNYATMFDKDGNSVSTMDHQAGYWIFVTGANNVQYAPSDAAYNFI